MINGEKKFSPLFFLFNKFSYLYKMSKIINLFGGPGIGKSSIAAGLTYKLKKKHISCDAPYEFPKVLAWDKNKEAIGDQLYVVANQHRGIAKSYGKVKYIIVDSPILLSLVYKNYYNNSETYPAKLYGKEFDNMVLSIFNQYDNLNIVLKRNTEGEHNDAERYQGLTESIELDNLIKYSLDTHNIPYIEVMVDDNTVNNIMAILDISKSLESTYQ
jgi:hypothetical protein